MSRHTIRGVGRRLGLEELRVYETTLVWWALAVHVATLAVVSLPGLSTVTWLRAALVFVDLTFVPGLLFLIAVDEFELSTTRLLYAAGSSLVLVMVTGVTINLLLPILGLYRPLSVPFLSLGTTALVGGLGLFAHRQSRARDDRLDLNWLLEREVTPIVPFSLLLLPATVIAIAVLHGYSANGPIIAVLTVIAVIPLLLVFSSRSVWYPLGIWGAAVSLLYHSTLSSQAHGGSPIPMRVMQVDRWAPGITEVAAPATSIVPNGVLYPAYATLSGIPYYAQTSFVNPLLVSLLPVVLFEAYRRYVSDTAALLGATIFMFAHPFYRLYPGGGRVATPVIFLALIGLLVAEDGLKEASRRLLSLMFAAGLIVSHYGTSYYAMLALFCAYALLWVLPTTEQAIGQVSKRGLSAVRRGVQFTAKRDGARVLTGSFVAFFGVLVLGWYMYTSGGGHFSLPRHVYHTVTALYEGSFFTSSTANRVSKSYGYGTASIRLARLVYIGLVGLMCVGMAVELVRRLVPAFETSFEDEYLAISAAFLGFAGSAFLLPVGWGGGRPMMIAFTFVAVFAVVAVAVPAKACRWVLNRVPIPIGVPSAAVFSRVAYAGVGVVLAVFLVLNTGVVAATVVGGSAPMNVPLQSEFDERENPNFRAQAYVETDVQTHAWLLDHRAGDYGVRGDLIASGQTDKYRSSIALAMDDPVLFPYNAWKPQGRLHRTEWGNRTEYTLILGHNQHLNVYTLYSTYERRPLEPLQDDLDARSVIYTTGDSRIYFGGNGTASTGGV